MVVYIGVDESHKYTDGFVTLWNLVTLRTAPVLCYMVYPSETHFELKSREVSFTYFAVEILYRARQWYKHYKTIDQLKQILWTNEDLNLRWVSDGCPILHCPPVGCMCSIYPYSSRLLQEVVMYPNKYVRLSPWNKHPVVLYSVLWRWLVVLSGLV